MAATEVHGTVLKLPDGLNISDAQHMLTLLEFADLKYDQYAETGGLETLDAAIWMTRTGMQAFDALQVADYPAAARLMNFGVMLMARFELEGNPEDLDEATEVTQTSLQRCVPDSPDYAHILYSLSMLLANKYEQSSTEQFLHQSLEKAREAVKHGKQQTTALQAEFLCNLANRLEQCFDKYGAQKDLQEAIEHNEKVIEITDEPCLELPSWLSGLGNKLQARFENDGDLEDLKRAIDCAETAIKYSDENSLDMSKLLANLGSKLVRLYEQTGEKEVLDRAVMEVEKAVGLVPPRHLDRSLMLSNLATVMRSLYHQSSDFSLLQRAIEMLSEALHNLPETHIERPMMLFSLSNMFLGKFERTGKQEVLEDALRYNNASKAVANSKTGLWSKICLDSGLILFYRYQWTGDRGDLENAITALSGAMRPGVEGKLDFQMMLSVQSSMFTRRFELTRANHDLSEAIRLQKQSLELTPPGHASRSVRMNALGLAVAERFKRTGEVDDLRMALKLLHQAIDISTSDPYRLVSYRTNLSNIYELVYEHNKDINSLETAISLVAEALDGPTDHTDRAKMMSNLSGLLTRKVRTTQASDDEVQKMLETAEKAVRMTPEEDASRVTIVKNLGDCYRILDRPELDEQVLTKYKEAWETKNGLPVARLEAALRYLSHFQKCQEKDYTTASTISEEALSLLSLINDRALDREDRQDITSRIAGLAATACSLAIQTRKPVDRAIEVLEVGRGLIIGHLVDNKTDLTELRRVDPEIAARFESFRNDVNARVDDPENFRLRQAVERERRKASRELENLISKIRAPNLLPQFLLGPSPEKLKDLSDTLGPLVIVNITQIRSDAILITPTSTNVLHLPNLTYSDVTSWLSKDITSHQSIQEFGKKNKRCREFLAWLWYSCVQPIVTELQSLHSSPERQDRLLKVCWIGTGLANSLPFHAAGDLTAGPGNDALSCTISSYASTLKALAHTITSSSETATPLTRDSLFVAVAMPTTPGEDDLGRVEEELDAIKATFNQQLTVIPLTHPSARDVISHLQTCIIAHFACHAISSLRDPSKSHLLLQTPDADLADTLTVKDISSIDLRQAKLGVLSACSTADNPALSLADEVIHLASGFQVAGFEHVVATMWPTADDTAVEFTREFYRQLLVLGGLASATAVAESVRLATLSVRAKKPKQPLLWAQYVHWGP